jgi:hypothetical protein
MGASAPVCEAHCIEMLFDAQDRKEGVITLVEKRNRISRTGEGEENGFQFK